MSIKVTLEGTTPVSRLIRTLSFCGSHVANALTNSIVKFSLYNTLDGSLKLSQYQIKELRNNLLCFRLGSKKQIQVKGVKSSTIERKYLKPSTVTVLKGPQKSMWIRSKAERVKLLLETKDNHLCFTRWQIEQWKSLQETDFKCKILDICWRILGDGWPSL